MSMPRRMQPERMRDDLSKLCSFESRKWPTTHDDLLLRAARVSAVQPLSNIIRNNPNLTQTTVHQAISALY